MNYYTFNSDVKIKASNTPIVVIIFLAAAVVVALMTTNPLLTIAAVFVFPLLAKMTWIRTEPPILFFAVALQWLQISAAVFQADLQGRVLGTRPDPSEMEQAFWLGMIGLVVLAMGMRLAATRIRGSNKYQIEVDCQQISLKKIWRIYLLLFLLANLSTDYLWFILPIRSVSLALLALRWVAYFALAYVSLVAGKGIRQPALLVAIAMELIIGFTGYFSGFRMSLTVLLIAFLASKTRLSSRDLLPATAIIVFTVFLGIVWTGIKPQYRNYVNQGTGQQVVTVPVVDRLQMVVNLALEIDWIDAEIAAEHMLSRIAYIEMFAYAIDYVPRVKEHEGGGLWFSAIKHISTPRLFFPDKAVLDSDSELTMQYTGLHMASADQGTSISMGYMAESYIDFGVPLMFVPIFMIGYLWGTMYRYFINNTAVRFLGYGFAMIVLMGAAQFEIPSLKLLGGVLTNFIVLTLLNHFFLRRHVHKLLISQ